MKRIIYMFVYLLILLGSSVNATDNKINITYISHVDKNQTFGQSVHAFAKAAANDLDINLNIQYPQHNLNRFEYIDFAKKIFEINPKPDFIIAIFYRKMSVALLELSRKYDVPVFIVNTNIPNDDLMDVGVPRDKYKNFLGVIAANEFQAGYKLAKYLIQESRDNKQKSIIAISGPREATEAVERNKGLSQAVKEAKNSVLYQTLYTNWEEEQAYILMKRILKRYENIDILWTASDGLALGAKRAIVESDTKMNIIIGGIDWTKNGIDAVKNNELNATVGGHFMNAGFALVLLYDYFHGKDFKNELGTQIQLDMSLLTKENIKEYLDKFTTNNWDKINFKKYSKHLNPTFHTYDFSLDSLYYNFE